MKNNTFIENNKIITIIAYLLFFLSIPVYADFTQTWENASPSVVSVLPTWPGYEKPGFGAPPGTAPEGSGVIISTDGIIVTASHVVSSATEVIVRDINGVKYDAEIIFNDVDTDLALLQTSIINKNIIINDTRPKIGSKTCLISNSFGLDLNNQLDINKSSTQVLVTLKDMTTNEMQAWIKKAENFIFDDAEIKLKAVLHIQARQDRVYLQPVFVAVKL